MLNISAPANIKIAGEHSVVHGTKCISAAVYKLADTWVESDGSDQVTLSLDDLKPEHTQKFTKEDLKSINRSWEEKADVNSFISTNNRLSRSHLAFAYVASRLYLEYDVPVTGATFHSTSKVPVREGWGSSTSIGASFVGAVLAQANVMLKDADIVDVIRDVDRIIHKNPNAGAVDVPPVYYGGYVVGSPKSGYSRMQVSQPPNLLAVNVGPKVPTSDTVFVVSVKAKTYPERAREIFSSIDSIIDDEVEALGTGNAMKLGKLMNANQRLLVELGVSSEKLDQMTRIANKNGAYGAKLSGGGGGGMGIVNCEPYNNLQIADAMRRVGFNVERIETTDMGVKGQLERILRR